MLEQLRQEFVERQKRFGRKPNGGYPHSMRRRTVSMVMKGVPPEAVAKAVGISAPSIRNWCKELKGKIEPTELKLVEGDSADVSLNSRETRAKEAFIHFPSGLRVEVPLAALTAHFIQILNGVTL
jgi:hypothetical protein